MVQQLAVIRSSKHRGVEVFVEDEEGFRATSNPKAVTSTLSAEVEL